MKKALFAATILLFSGIANAEITTKAEADAYMEQRCVEIARSIQETDNVMAEAMNDAIENNDSEAVMGFLLFKDMFTKDAVDQYIELCK